MTRISPTSILLLAMALASCAGPPGSRAGLASSGGTPRNQCFTPREVTNFAAADDKTVNLRVSTNRIYSLTLLGVCPDIDWNNTLAIRAAGGSSWICTGLDATVTTRGPSGQQTCDVTSIRQLSPEEIAALPKGARP
jgi:hypothetical protein